MAHVIGFLEIMFFSYMDINILIRLGNAIEIDRLNFISYPTPLKGSVITER